VLQAYNQGMTTDEAFLSTIGMDAGAFETQWADELGVPDDYITPTPWVLPTFRPAPTMVVRGQTVPTEEPGAETAPTAITTPEKSTPIGTAIPCLSFVPIFILGLGTIFYRKNKQP